MCIRLIMIFMIQGFFCTLGLAGKTGSSTPNGGSSNGLPFIDGSIQSEHTPPFNPQADTELKANLSQPRSLQKGAALFRPRKFLAPSEHVSEIRLLKNIEVLSFSMDQKKYDLTINKKSGEIKIIQKRIIDPQLGSLEMKSIFLEQPFMSLTSVTPEFKMDQTVNIIPLKNQKKVFISFGKQFIIFDLSDNQNLYSRKLAKSIDYSLLTKDGLNLLLFGADQVFVLDVSHPIIEAPQLIMTLKNPLQGAPVVMQFGLRERFIKIQEQFGMSFYLDESTLEVRLEAHEANWVEPSQVTRVNDSENPGQFIEISGKGSRFLKISRVVPGEKLSFLDKIKNKWISGRSFVVSTFKEFTSPLLSHPLMAKMKNGENVIVTQTDEYFFIYDSNVDHLVDLIPIQKLEAFEPMEHEENSDRFIPITLNNEKQIGLESVLKKQKQELSALSDGTLMGVIQTPAGGLYIVNKSIEMEMSSIHRFNQLTAEEEALGISKEDLALTVTTYKIRGYVFSGVILNKGYFQNSFLIYDLHRNLIYTIEAWE